MKWGEDDGGTEEALGAMARHYSGAREEEGEWSLVAAVANDEQLEKHKAHHGYEAPASPGPPDLPELRLPTLPNVATKGASSVTSSALSFK